MAGNIKKVADALTDEVGSIKRRLRSVEQSSGGSGGDGSDTHTPDNRTLQAIQDALDEHQEVRLEPAVVYDGDACVDDENGNSINLSALSDR